MNKIVPVKVVTVIQVGDRRYVNPKLAAAEYAAHATYRLFQKYRMKYAAKHNGDRYGLATDLDERMYRRVLPIFQRMLGA